MNLEEAVASVLKEERLRKGFSQEELAYNCEIDRTYISLIERKKRKPTLNVIFRICKSLDVKPSYFIKKIETLVLDGVK